MGCHSALQGIFPTQGLNLSLTSPALAGDYLTVIYLSNATSKMIRFPVNGFSGVLGGSDSKESVCNAGDLCWEGSLGWEDPLEEGMATHSIILAWKIPWTEEPGELQTTRSQQSTGLSD